MGKKTAGCQWMAVLHRAVGSSLLGIIIRDNNLQFGVAGLTLYPSLQDSIVFTCWAGVHQVRSLSCSTMSWYIISYMFLVSVGERKMFLGGTEKYSFQSAMYPNPGSSLMLVGPRQETLLSHSFLLSLSTFLSWIHYVTGGFSWEYVEKLARSVCIHTHRPTAAQGHSAGLGCAHWLWGGLPSHRPGKPALDHFGQGILGSWMPKNGL